MPVVVFGVGESMLMIQQWDDVNEGWMMICAKKTPQSKTTDLSGEGEGNRRAERTV